MSQTLATLIAAHAATAPAIGAPGRDWLTYGALRDLSGEVGAALHGQGIGRGDRVAIVLPNGPEMAVALKTGGVNIPVDSALDHVFGYALSLDMTRRDLQGAAKKKGRPWEVGKAFERSAPIGPILPASDIGHPSEGRLELTVNGETKQEGDLNQMIWKVPEMISYLSDHFELAPGDVILSGTPAGVGPITRGDVMELSIEGLGSLKIPVV